MENNFLECRIDDANRVDLKIYKFVKYDETRGLYVFMKRMRL